MVGTRGALLALVLMAAPSLGAAAGPFSSTRAIDGAIEIKTPERLPEALEPGATLFADRCAACHGESGSGSTQGPPLIHVIYEPGHHGDGAFYNAVLNGVRGHHWRYGDMQPVSGVSPQDVAEIVRYIRALQRLNGIH